MSIEWACKALESFGIRGNIPGWIDFFRRVGTDEKSVESERFLYHAHAAIRDRDGICGQPLISPDQVTDEIVATWPAYQKAMLANRRKGSEA